MDHWLIIHRYRRLVKRGIAAPLGCPDCGTPVAVAIGPDDEPMLRCYEDDILWQPGLGFYGDMKSVVSEHYLD